MDALPAPVSGTLECLALLGIGYNLRSTGVFSLADAQTALRIAGFTTLPAVILQACTTYPGVGWEALAGGSVVLLTALLSTAAAWGLNAKRHKRERAAIAGCCVGGAAASVGLPFIEAALGPAGVAAAAAALLCNTLAVYGASYLLFGSAGPAFPESYTHEDGGTYRGEWRGMVKEGLGVYRYPSGARYEGEWRGNLKDGRGVYHYPKGGTYEGEWSGGAMNGVGVRTYSNGRVVAGRWRANQLESPLELWQCAPAAEGAAEAALAAQAVPVGGGRPRDALLLIAARPELWASVLGLGAVAAVAAGWGIASGGSGSGTEALLGGLGAVVAALAPANKPLMLMASGMLLDFKLPDARQAADVFAIVATRTAAALFVSANALALLGIASPAAAGATAAVPAALAALFVCLAPAPQAAKAFARNFRLNEALAGSAVDASGVAGVVLCAAVALGATAAGLVPAAGSAVAAAAASTHLATALLALSAVLCVAAGPIHGRLNTDRRVRMVYKGPGAGDSSQQQQQGGAVSDTTAGSSAAAGGEQGGGAGESGGSGSGGVGPKSPAAAAVVQSRQQGWRQEGGQQRPFVCMGRRGSSSAGVVPAPVAPPRRAAAFRPRPRPPPLRAVQVAAAAQLPYRLALC